MRVWEKIKVNDVVICKEEKHIVEKIYKEGSITYGVLKNINTQKECVVPLYCCRKDEN